MQALKKAPSYTDSTEHIGSLTLPRWDTVALASPPSPVHDD